MKRRLKLLSILVLAAFAFLAAAEVAVRAFRPQPAFYAIPGLYVADPFVGHRMRPGLRGVIGNWTEFTTQVRINSLGIRGPEPGPRRAGLQRVLVLGDSFTFGTGVEEEEAFPARIAARLSRGGIPTEAINAGIGGYGVPDEVAWFERYGAGLHPDLIVLGIFTGNDLQDAAPDRPRTFVVDGDILDEAELHRSRPLHWLFQHSQLFALLKFSIPQSVDRPLRRALHMPEPGAIRGLREEMALYDPRNRPAAERGGARSETAIRRLLAITRADHIAVAAILLPSKLQADERQWGRTLRQLSLSPSAADRALPNEVFSGVLARCGVPFLDLTPPFSDQLRRGKVLFFPEDQHFTTAGHEVVADRTVAFLLNLRRRAG
ncbi:MAG TPA: GDSL-type esterase/lipase family protein [Thermoanaerobaculia bacterium]